MNKIKYTLCLLLFVHTSIAQIPNTWTQKANYSGLGIQDPIGFSIDSFGYAGLGYYSSGIHYYYPTDFWQFNPFTNTWVQKASFPGAGRTYEIFFVINSKAYVGLGSAFNDPNGYNDLWQYDPATDMWTQMTNFSGGKRASAIGFSVGNYGYVGLGVSDTTNGIWDDDIWQYDPMTDTWTQKGNFPGGGRENAIGLSIGDYGYVGFGDSTGLYNYLSDFWQYDPTSDSWIREPNFPGKPREAPFVFSFADRGYIGTGIDSSGKTLNDFWEYNSLMGVWIEKDSFGGGQRAGAFGFSISNMGYAGTGGSTGAVDSFYNDFWMYTPDSINTGIKPVNQTSISIYPDPATDRIYINNLPPLSTLKVCDLTGRSVNTVTTGNEIDVSALPAGIYILHIQDSDGEVVKKFVKE